MKTIISLVAGLFMSIGVAQANDALDQVRESGVLQFAVYENFPPYSYKVKGRGVGLDVEVARAIAEKLGVVGAAKMVGADENMEDDLRNNVWKGHYIGGGVVHVMMHVPLDPEFAEENDKVNILAPYYREQIVVGVKRSLGGPGFDMSIFTEEKIGVELDTLADIYRLSAYQGQLRDNVVHYRNLTEASEALKRGEIAAIMGPRGEVEASLSDRKADFMVGPVRMPGVRQSGWDVGMAIKASNPQLTAAVSDAMVELHKEGRIAHIFEKYGLTYQAPSIQRR